MALMQFEQDLVELNALETVGKKHFESYGSNISYLQYLYLRNHGMGKDLGALYTPSAIAEQERIQAQFRENNASHILKPQNFFPEGQNIEAEKLLRFVDIPPHQHDFIECAFVFCGKCIHNISGQAYIQEAGSFVPILPGYPHALYPEEDCLCITIKIRNETFQKMEFPGLVNLIYPMAFSCGEDTFVRHCIVSIWEQQESGLPYADKIIEQLFITMMLYIEQQFHDEVQYLVSGNKQDKQMVEILSYMMDNYRSATLQAVAAHFHYNPAYFSRMFRTQTGVTFSAMLKEYKLRQAARLLVETGRKLNDICDEVGYKDTTQFIRSFKVLFGTTPIQYRKQGSIQQ